MSEPEEPAAETEPSRRDELDRLRATLEAREAQLRQILDLVPVILFAKDWEGRFLLANRALAKAYGTTVDEILDTWHGDLDHRRGQVSRMLAEDRAVMTSGEPLVVPERRFVDRSGREHIFQITKIPFLTGDDRKAVVGIAIDLTEQRRAEERFRVALESAPNGMLMTDTHGVIVLVNREFEHVLGHRRGTVRGRRAIELVPERLRARCARLGASIVRGERRRGALRDKNLTALHRDGHEIPVEVGMNAVQTDEGTFVLASIVDITQRLKARTENRRLHAEMEQRVEERTAELVATNARLEEVLEELRSTQKRLERANARLEEQIREDPLTGLGNRRAFDDHLDEELRRMTRSRLPLSLLMIDVDDFKEFNDRHGHPAGDECLRSIARCVASVLHRPGDFAARYGGEELAVVLPETTAEGAVLVAEQIRQRVRARTPVTGPDTVTVSIGTATMAAADTPRDSRELVRRADAALYEAKHGGRDRVCRESTDVSGDRRRNAT